MPVQRTNEALLELLRTKLSSQILESSLSLGDVVVRIDRQHLVDFFRLLKLDADLAFNFFLDVTAVDWLDAQAERFELVYHLLSLTYQQRLRVKIWVPEDSAEVSSLCGLWSAANFMEREVWDMYGIKFTGHPDLRRILTYDEFEGHPLRKDYPVQGKQPRVKMLHPEVENTARLMHRPELIRINPRKGSASPGEKHP